MATATDIKVKPLADRVVVRALEDTEQMRGGLYIPDTQGRTITSESVVGPPRPGRRIVYTGDTRPCPEVAEAAVGADLLIHEATFASDERERAISTGHSTALEAAEIAAGAGALRLALTHFSPRYADDPRILEREARAAFPGAVAAHDGLLIEVPYRDE